jgi:hypothetical protein
MQRGNWHALYLYHALWLPNKEIAAVVLGAAQAHLINKRLRGWFKLMPTEARGVIVDSAARVYPGVRLFEHAEMVRLLHS